MGQFEAAERDLEEAMTIFEQKLGRTHPRVASVLHTRGVIAVRRGSTERAATLLRESIRVCEAALPPDHPDLARVIHDLGEVFLVADDHASALPQFVRAAKLRRTRLGKAHASIANSLTGAGRSLAGLGRPDEAAVVLEEALGMHQALGNQGQWLAETEAALSKVLVSTDPGRARKLALSARATFSAMGKPDEARALDDLVDPVAP
ncbi:MAG: tetratricopeptide repeat protein [Nannocystaceae bacterium]|nr:tetratricopeptide repeat protein [Nannocystaceae bacterium]